MRKPTFSQELAALIEDGFLRDGNLEAVTARDIAGWITKTKSAPRTSLVKEVQRSLKMVREILEASENKMLIHLVSEDYFTLYASRDLEQLSEHERKCCVPGHGPRRAYGVRRVLGTDDPIFVEWLNSNRRRTDGEDDNQVSRVTEGYGLGLLTEEQAVRQLQGMDRPSSARQERHMLESAQLRAVSHQPKYYNGQEHYDKNIKPFLKDNKGRWLYPPKDLALPSD